MKVKFKNYWSYFGKKKVYGLAVLKLKVSLKDECKSFHLTALNFGVKLLFMGKKK